MGVNPQIACRKIFSLTKIIKKNSFVCEFNKGRKMDYLDDMRLKKEKVEHRHGVIANQKGGVIANFYNNYNRLCELFNCSWRTYVSSNISY